MDLPQESINASQNGTKISVTKVKKRPSRKKPLLETEFFMPYKHMLKTHQLLALHGFSNSSMFLGHIGKLLILRFWQTNECMYVCTECMNVHSHTSTHPHIVIGK